MYFVVFWDKSSGVVPKSWIDTVSKTLKWPKSKNPIIQIIKADIPKDSWFTYHYSRLFGPYETYDEAREFEVDTLNLSTNDDEGFASLKAMKRLEKLEKKRICNKPLRYCDTSEDESTSVVQPKSHLSISPPPTNYISKMKNRSSKTFKNSKSSHLEKTESQVKTSNEHSTYKSESIIHNINDNNTKCNNLKVNSPEQTLQKSNNFSLNECFNETDYSSNDEAQLPLLDNDFNINKNQQDISNDSSQTVKSKVIQSIKPQITSNIKSNIPIKIKTINDQRSIVNAERQLLDSIHTPTEFDDNEQLSLLGSSEANCHQHGCCRKLMSEIRSLKAMVSSIYLTLSDKNDMAGNDILKEKIDFKLPIHTKNQLSIFEQKIEDVTAATQYQEMIKQLGGASFEKHVRSALVLTVSDVMAYRMTWTGTKNTIMVKQLKFIELITDTITKKWSSADKKKIEAVIKSWLQHAGDRIK